CTMESAIKDIRNRFILQTKIWDNVLNLRMGRYYNEQLPAFKEAIEACRSNIYDAPDLTYVHDEGAILRRILGAFAVRPTLVATSKLYNVIGAHGLANLNNIATGLGGQFTDVTTIPMITLRLPITKQITVAH